MSRRAALTVALLVALPACGSSDQPTVVHVGTHENPHPNLRPVAADPTQGLADALALRTPKPRATRNARSRSAVTPPHTSPPSGNTLEVTSTAYCETGLMANGQHTYAGAVAMNGQPIGSRWHVVETDAVYTVADRIGHGSQFDIAMPGDCDGARRYGRRTIHVERVA